MRVLERQLSLYRALIILENLGISTLQTDCSEITEKILTSHQEYTSYWDECMGEEFNRG
jgi:hypothetical protein